MDRPEGWIEQALGPGQSAAVGARAPGRVNLIGEHTDYNGGFVLPIATPQTTHVVLAPRPGSTVTVRSVTMGDETATYELGKEVRRGHWIDYFQGVTLALRERGIETSGFDAVIDSTVPVGGGLSSSAALEVASLRALREAFGLEIDDVTIALLAQRGENELVGAPVGVMDPMASSLATTGSALFLDCRSLSYELVLLPENAGLVVIDSGVAHDHAAGEYRTRREECEHAAKLLGVASLRELTVGELANLDILPAPLGQRARHVVTENARVAAAVLALRAGDLETLGDLFDRSHASMRDDYEVSIPEIDALVEIARALPEVYGARLTGGGFGGSVVVLSDKASARSVGDRIARDYGARGGRAATVLMPPAGAP